MKATGQVLKVHWTKTNKQIKARYKASVWQWSQTCLLEVLCRKRRGIITLIPDASLDHHLKALRVHKMGSESVGLPIRVANCRAFLKQVNQLPLWCACVTKDKSPSCVPASHSQSSYMSHRNVMLRQIERGQQKCFACPRKEKEAKGETLGARL